MSRHRMECLFTMKALPVSIALLEAFRCADDYVLPNRYTITLLPSHVTLTIMMS